MRLANLKSLTSKELIHLITNDAPTWDVFAKGYTCGINQCGGAATTEKLKKYRPRELRDLAAFIAAIRPGFKSQLNSFLAREKFSYHIPAFDHVLQNDSSGSSWMLYQENTMTALNLAGFSMERTYPIIKAISKKKKKVIEAAKEEFLAGFARYIVEHEESVDEQTAFAQAAIAWKVIEDSSSYLFNSSHAVAVALDALYGAYLKAHYPVAYYTALLTNYANKGDTEMISRIKQEMRSGFGIRMTPCRFRQDNRAYTFDAEKKTITDVLHAMKGVGPKVSDKLYAMRDMRFGTFVDALIYIREKTSINSAVMNTLIRSGYFEEFGSTNRLLAVYAAFYDGDIHYDIKYVEKTKTARIAALKELERTAEDGEPTPLEQIRFEAEVYGAPYSVIDTPETKLAYVVTDVQAKRGSPRLTLYSIRTGSTQVVKVRKDEFASMPLEVGDVMRPGSWKEKPQSRMVDGKWKPIPNTREWWFYDYTKISA